MENTKMPQGAGMPFVDMNQIFSQLKIPGVDLSAIFEARRKDIEALTQVNQHAYEGVQALVRREAEMMQQAVAELQSALKSMAAKSPGELASKGTELAKQAIERALANMRELAEIASKSQSQAYDVVNKRFQENLQELRQLLQPK